MEMHYHPSVLCLANLVINRIINSATGCQVQSFYECEKNTHEEYDQSCTTHLWQFITTSTVIFVI